MTEIFKKMKLSVLIVLFSFALFYAVPMTIGILTKSMTKEDVAKRMKSVDQVKYSKCMKEVAQIDSSISILEGTLLVPGEWKDVVLKIEYLAKKRKKIIQQFKIGGLNNNKIAIIYPISISLLSLTYFVFLPKKNVFGLLDHLKVIVPVFIFIYGFTWYRTLEVGQYGRTIFSPFNLDINPYLYYSQFFCILSFITLIIMIWLKSISDLRSITSLRIESIDTEEVIQYIKEMKQNYYLWQFLSVVLFGVFGFYSLHFWQAVFKYFDFRYFYQSIVFNMLWIISWVIVSLPLIKRMEKWQEFKNRVLLEDSSQKNISQLQKYFENNSIISNYNQAISTALMVLSFLIPLIKAIY